MFYGQDTSCWGAGGVSMSVRLLMSVSTYIGCPLCFILCFLVVIMSQISTTMAMTTTPPVTVVSSGMPSISSVTVAPSLMGLPAMLGQHDVVLLPPLTPKCSGGVLGLASATAATSIFIASSDLCQLCHGFSTGSFFFRLEPPLFCILYVWCLFWCLLSTFRFPAGFHIHPWGLNHWGLHPCNPMEFTCGRHMCNLVMVISPHKVCTDLLLPPQHLSRGSLLLLNLLCPSNPIYMVGHTALGAWQRVT